MRLNSRAFHVSYVTHTHTHTPLCVCGSGSPHHLRLVGCVSCWAVKFASSAAVLTGTICPSWCGDSGGQQHAAFPCGLRHQRCPRGAAGNSSSVRRRRTNTERNSGRAGLQCPLVAGGGGDTSRFLPFLFLHFYR